MKNLKAYRLYEDVSLPLLVAVRSNNIERVAELMNADIDLSNGRALDVAITNHYDEIAVMMLADDRVDPSSNINFILKHSSNQVAAAAMENSIILQKINDVDPYSDNYDYSAAVLKTMISNVEYDNVATVLPYLKLDAFILADMASDIIKYSSRNPQLDYVARDTAKLLLLKLLDSEDDNFDYQKFQNSIMRTAVVQQTPVYLKILIDDIKYDPSFNENWVFKLAQQRKDIEMLKVLLADERVLNTLNSDDFGPVARELLVGMYDYINSVEDVETFINML